MSEPLPRIDVNMYCTQTMSQQPVLVVYSGPIVSTPFQYGHSSVNVETGGFHSRNGLGKTGGNTCSSPINFVGDCWQSVSRLAVTPNAPKWLIATGAPNMCGYDGLAVWKWDAPTKVYKWHGFISNQTDRQGLPQLDGDVAWSVQDRLAQTKKWSRFDLNAMTVTRDHPDPGAFAVQTGVQGYTYTVHPIHPVPIPDPYLEPTKFYWQREGGVPPMPNPYAAWIEQLYNEGITAGCAPAPPGGKPRYCPDAPVTRAEMAVFLLKIKHGAGYVPPPCAGIFDDVTCGGQ
jgi:hypothetical protein